MTRSVSVGVARKLKFGRNWGYAAIMMIVAFLLLRQTECGTSMWDRQTTATVTDVEVTSTSENDEHIYRIHYTFRDDRGTVHEGTSYSTTKYAGEQPVLYVARAPDESRLVDARSKPFGTLALLFGLVVFGASIATAGTAYANGKRWAHLLRHGREATGIATSRVLNPGDSETADRWRITFVDEGHRTYALTTTDEDFPSKVRILYDGALMTTIEEIPEDLLKEPAYSAHLFVLPCVTLGFAIATIVSVL